MTVFLAKITKDGGMDMGSKYNAARFRQFCKENIGKTLRIEQEKPVRSLNQNSYYWVYLKIISMETGNEPEDLHEFFKSKLLPRKFTVIHGKKKDHEIEIPKSTTDLSKADFAEYMEKICALTGVPLPDPADAGYFKG